MNRLLRKTGFALVFLTSSSFAMAQAVSDGDQAQSDPENSTSSQQQDAADEQQQGNQDSSSQDVAQVADEDETAAGRFIPTEQLSQDLGASFPVDI